MVYQVQVARGRGGDHRLPKRHRLEQRLRQSLAARRQEHQVQQVVEGPDLAGERNADHGVRRRDGARAGPERPVGRDPRQDEPDGRAHPSQRVEHDTLILGPRDDAEGPLAGSPLDPRPPCIELRGQQGSVHPLRHQPVRDDGQLARGRSLAPERVGHCGAHRDHAGGRPAREPVLQCERPGHLATGEHQRRRQPPTQREPGEGLPVPGALRVHQVHRMAREQRRECRSVGAPLAGPERERVHLEPPVARQRLDLRPRGTDEAHRHPGRLQPKRQMERRGHGARAATLMEHLHHSDRHRREDGRGTG